MVRCEWSCERAQSSKKVSMPVALPPTLAARPRAKSSSSRSLAASCYRAAMDRLCSGVACCRAALECLCTCSVALCCRVAIALKLRVCACIGGTRSMGCAELTNYLVGRHRHYGGVRKRGGEPRHSSRSRSRTSVVRVHIQLDALTNECDYSLQCISTQVFVSQPARASLPSQVVLHAWPRPSLATI